MAFEVPVPEAANRMALLERCGYEDAFGVTVAVERSPGEWARLIVAAAPAALLWVISFAQGRLLGLDLGAPDSAHPLGWNIVREDGDAIVLAADGPGGAARIIGTTPPGQLVITTRARFDGVRRRAIWKLVAPLHRRIAGYLLDRAAQEAGRR